MPTSPFGHINSLVGYLLMINPSSLLDIGLGNGKIGFIARDALDVMLGERYKREQWRIKIDGIDMDKIKIAHIINPFKCSDNVSSSLRVNVAFSSFFASSAASR